jgi:kinetochore protein NDC80
LRHKTGLLQDYLTKEIHSHMDVIVKAKQHASDTLKGIKEFAEAHRI